MTQDLASVVPVADWRGSLSMFAGYFETQPREMRECIDANTFVSAVAPERPVLVSDKTRGGFFLPSILREAPLTGKSLERALARGLPTTGIQRSAAHVVEGAVIKLDIDGATKAKVKKVVTDLRQHGVAFVLYSTHSHGAKPGVRARMLLFLDRPLPPHEYKRASQGAALLAVGASLDPSEGYLHQLAGTYVAHPERAHLTFRVVNLDGYCVSADAMLQAAPPSTSQIPQHFAGQISTTLTPSDRERIKRALEWCDPNGFTSWTKVGMMLKACQLGDEGRGHWLAFSARGHAQAQQHNAQNQYDPETMWERFAPTVTPQTALATLLALAREGAGVVAEAEIQARTITPRGEEGLIYLGRYHPKFADQITSKV